MINNIKLDDLDAFHFRIFIQLLNLSLSIEEYADLIDFDGFYEQLNNLDDQFKEDILVNDLASKTDDKIRLQIREEVETVCQKIAQKSSEKGKNIP